MATCKACGSEITFRRLPNGKQCPVELDGSDHFDKCSERKTKVVMEYGKPFEDRAGNGFIYGGKRIYHMIRGPTITGPAYKAKEHVCGVLPWESCNC